jgi:peptidoglycan/xylan/chitin deacetylase (PgdA/CDA1 family)
MRYLVHTPFWLRWVYPEAIWSLPSGERSIYLTFDDGPQPEATSFVLDRLAEHGAAATFFCVGENVIRYPELFSRILEEGHAVGNHTQHHLNGFDKSTEEYVRDVEEASKHIPSLYFRPPYGRIRRNQRRQLKSKGFSMVMWSVLSGDFDSNCSPQQCLQRVLRRTNRGSVVLFHDSEKAWKNMSYTLPRVLEHFSKQGFLFRKIAV